MKSGYFVAASFFLLALASGWSTAIAEDIPLQRCDRLPVVQVKIANNDFLFLVDTGATSMLNLKSFPHGAATHVSVSSWTGTVEATAQNIVIPELIVGLHHVHNLKLPAVDLSQIGNACGRRIDGIVGVDLLSQLGATVDIKNQIAHLADTRPEATRIAELQEQLAQCEEAFNRADEKQFSECLAPHVVVFSAAGDYYGRDASMEYYRKRYFSHNPPAHLLTTARAHHAIGDAIWVEYDMRIVVGSQVIQTRGTALCEKSDGRWRIVHMNHSAPPPDSTQAKAAVSE
jgi:ketosteroid isomerase-like protein